MRILHVIPTLTPKNGGSVNVCFNLSRTQARKGHEVYLATTKFGLDSKYASTLTQVGVKVIAFAFQMQIKGFIISLGLDSWLNDHIREFDILHLHDFRTFQSIVVWRQAKRYNIPYALQPHASTPRVISMVRSKFLFDVFFGFRILRNASQVIAVSEEEAAFDIKLGAEPKRVNVVFNGIDPEITFSRSSSFCFKDRLKIKGPMILYLGRIHESKGLDFFLEGFRRVVKQQPSAVFVISGNDDGYKHKLVRIISRLDLNDRVIFTGYLSEEEKMAIMSEADLFVCTARYMGGVSIAPLEAIMSGVPVIVTPEAGELIKKSNSGFIVEYGDVSKLAQIIVFALTNGTESRKMIRRGQDYLLSRLQWNSVSNKIFEIYDSALIRANTRLDY